MQKPNGHAPCESPLYLLSDEELLALQDIRDQLLFHATLAQANTSEEDRVPLIVTRAALGDSYELCALRLDKVLKAITQVERRGAVQ